MSLGGNGGVRAMKLGDTVASAFTGDQAGIQAALDYCNSPGGIVQLGPGTYNITGLTMYAKTTLKGAGAQNTILSHTGSSTGIREKTAGEGNGASGATGIILDDFSLRASGSTGDGINLGFQGGATFTSNAAMRGLLVRDFTTGTGIKVSANAVQVLTDCWTVSNSVGLYIDGGASNIFGLWAEGNTDTNIRIISPWNNFVCLHLEDGGIQPSSCLMEVGPNGDYSIFIGVTIKIAHNQDKLIREMSGNHYCQYPAGVYVDGGAFTWNHTIYNEGNTKGVGTHPQYIPFNFDGSRASNYWGYFRNTDTGVYMPVRGETGFQNIDGLSAMSSASTITPDGFSSYCTLSGSANCDNIGTNAAWVGREITIQSTGTATIKHNSGGTGNIRTFNGADIVLTNNDVVKFMQTPGLLWIQSAPIVTLP